MLNKIFHNDGDKRILKRQWPVGVLFVFLSAVIVLLFFNGVSEDSLATFVLSHANSTLEMSDIVLPTLVALRASAIIILICGLLQIGIKNGKLTTILIGIVSLVFTFSFITWNIKDDSISLTGLLNVMVVRSVPLIIGAMSGILAERAGIFNIAIEGMMLAAALTASVTASLTNLWIGLVVGIITGGLMSVIHALMCVKYKANHIISGTIINLFSIGITSYFSEKYVNTLEYKYLNNPGFFFPYEIPVLSQIPLIGPVLFNQNIFVYLMYILVAVLSILLFKTRWGLRLRSVGEHPKAADTLGINVFKTRFMAVIYSGLTAGIGGAFFSIGSIGSFNEQMTAGRGYIALAAMIFGKWNPTGAVGAGLLFGLAESISLKLSIFDVAVPAKILAMLPYVITIIVLGGVVGKNVGPAAGGKPYQKESL